VSCPGKVNVRDCAGADPAGLGAVISGLAELAGVEGAIDGAEVVSGVGGVVTDEGFPPVNAGAISLSISAW